MVGGWSRDEVGGSKAGYFVDFGRELWDVGMVLVDGVLLLGGDCVEYYCEGIVLVGVLGTGVLGSGRVDVTLCRFCSVSGVCFLRT